MPTSSTAQACNLCRSIPTTQYSKQTLEPVKFRRKSGQEIDFSWKEQKRNGQCVKSAKDKESMAKEEIRKGRDAWNGMRERELETLQWYLPS